MARPPNIIPPVSLRLKMPKDLRARLDLHLWSDTEGRVPQGAYQRLICQLIRDHLDRTEKSNASVS